MLKSIAVGTFFSQENNWRIKTDWEQILISLTVIKIKSENKPIRKLALRPTQS